MYRIAAAATLLLIPSVVMGAGFAKGSLFLSQEKVVEGDTVFIHGVVQNDTAQKFTGELVFKEGETKLGTAPVSLGAGEASTASISWRPTAGSHSIVAELQQGGTVTEKQSATFSVAEKPRPAGTATGSSTQTTATVQSSEQIQQQIASLSPGAAAASEPVFTLIDGGRERAADFFESQITDTKKKLAQNTTGGKVSGAETERLPDTVDGFWYALYTLYLYALTLLLFLIGNAAIFYPLLAVAFLYSLWRLYRRMRRGY